MYQPAIAIISKYVKSAGGWDWAWSDIQWGSDIPSLHLLDKQVFSSHLPLNLAFNQMFSLRPAWLTSLVEMLDTTVQKLFFAVPEEEDKVD